MLKYNKQLKFTFDIGKVLKNLKIKIIIIQKYICVVNIIM